MTQHTPEPWLCRGDTVYFPNLAGGFSLHRCPSPEANASRIVACVNACAGMTTEELEEFNDGSLKNWIDDAEETLKAVCEAVENVNYSGRCEQGIYKVKKQRDELLDDMMRIRDAFNTLPRGRAEGQMIKIAIEAIANGDKT